MRSRNACRLNLLMIAIIAGPAWMISACQNPSSTPPSEPPAESPTVVSETSDSNPNVHRSTPTFDPPQARKLTVEAMDQGDEPVKALELLSRALQLRPNYLDPLLLMAGVHLTLDDEQTALETVAALSALGHDLPLDRDPRLEKLWDHPELLEALSRQRESATRVVTPSTTAFRLQQPDLIPESVVYDPATADFYISSVRQRKILRYTHLGGVLEVIGPDSEGIDQDEAPIFSILGMAIDPDRRVLWAVSAALPQAPGFTDDLQNRSELLKIDLESGSLVERLPPPAGSPSQLNDVAIAPDGTVYATSSLPPGQVFRGSPEGLEPFGEPGWRSPQGLTVSADGNTLFVADYSYGIAAVDLETGHRVWLEEPEGFFLSGIDGLTRVGEDLIAIQNGIRPHRVLRLSPDLEHRRIRRAEVLEQNHPEYSEPTLGVGISGPEGHRFVYVANSQWDRFDADQNLPPLDQLDTPLFLSLEIGEWAQSESGQK